MFTNGLWEGKLDFPLFYIKIHSFREVPLFSTFKSDEKVIMLGHLIKLASINWRLKLFSTLELVARPVCLYIYNVKAIKSTMQNEFSNYFVWVTQSTSDLTFYFLV